MLQEGLAKILYKVDNSKKQESNVERGAVFYNPVQEFNRDTSIMVIKQYAESLKKEKEAK